ncbi:hypothetical protein EJ07DRAFT_172415 [Lizonia empirigonia]|nr:hypothetical protein EJ07DRAFT_172415 [Lizonia empirigonia]
MSISPTHRLPSSSNMYCIEPDFIIGSWAGTLEDLFGLTFLLALCFILATCLQANKLLETQTAVVTEVQTENKTLVEALVELSTCYDIVARDLDRATENERLAVDMLNGRFSEGLAGVDLASARERAE